MSVPTTPMPNPPDTPPHWDIAAVYPSPNSPEFRRALDAFAQDLADLDARLDPSDALHWAPVSPDAATIAAFEALLAAYDRVLTTAWHIESYLMALVDTDAADTGARAAASELRPLLAHLSALGHRLTAWVAAVDLDALLAASAIARDLAYPLGRARERAAHALSEPQENLAAALHVDGGAAWTRLHADLTATMTARLRIDGEERIVPLTTLRGMATDPDRDARRRAFVAEVAGWEAHAVPLAAALNGVKGEAAVLSERRGWASPLDAALAEQGLARATLDALIVATREALPDFRRYLLAKARLLGVPRLAWYDLTAPVGHPAEWTFTAAVGLIQERFRAYAPALGDLAERALRERWIDAEPRPGKRGGGLCLWFDGGVSRIRLEFRPSYDSVRTLAHELGHAYHAAVQHKAGRTALQIEATPPPLAETASKFCEELIRHEVSRQAERSGRATEQIAILDAYLTAARRSIVGSLELFLFEDQLFTARRARELSVAELHALLLAARAETTGDALDPAAPYPWTWAALPHLYLDGVSFYNLPYLFGQLFALGLYARYQEDPAGFVPAFDDFLASSGLADPATLAARFGIDLHSPAFWRAGLATIRADIDRFALLTQA